MCLGFSPLPPESHNLALRRRAALISVSEVDQILQECLAGGRDGRGSQWHWFCGWGLLGTTYAHSILREDHVAWEWPITLKELPSILNKLLDSLRLDFYLPDSGFRDRSEARGWAWRRRLRKNWALTEKARRRVCCTGLRASWSELVCQAIVCFRNRALVAARGLDGWRNLSAAGPEIL